MEHHFVRHVIITVRAIHHQWLDVLTVSITILQIKLRTNYSKSTEETSASLWTASPVNKHHNVSTYKQTHKAISFASCQM